MKRDPKERFMANVAMQAGPDPCWLWTGFLNSDGYGSFYLDRQMGSHRAAYTLFIGAIPDGHQIKQRCGNHSCVNPMHLNAIPYRCPWLYTRESTHKMSEAKHNKSPSAESLAKRSRSMRIAKRKGAKLDVEKVRRIHQLRAEGWSLTRIGAEFGVRFSTIQRIIKGEIWVLDDQ